MTLRAVIGGACRVNVLEIAWQIPVAALVLLRDCKVPRRKCPIKGQVVPPPRDYSAGAVDDRRQHAVDTAPRFIRVLDFVTVEIRAIHADRKHTGRRCRNAVMQLQVQPPNPRFAEVQVRLVDIYDRSGTAGARRAGPDWPAGNERRKQRIVKKGCWRNPEDDGVLYIYFPVIHPDRKIVDRFEHDTERAVGGNLWLQRSLAADRNWELATAVSRIATRSAAQRIVKTCCCHAGSLRL